MKGLLIAGLLVISSNVFAAKFANIKSLTNPELDKAASSLISTEHVNYSSLKKVISLTGGKNDRENRKNAVAQALHTVCPYFDDGVGIGLNSKDAKGTKIATEDLTMDSVLTEQDAEYKVIAGAVEKINSFKSVELYSGAASGNNTAGSVLGFYDLDNNEVAVFAATNCGSDD